MKSGLAIGCGALVLLVLGIGIWLVGAYNGLVTAEETVDQQWAEIDNQLKRRADLIPNLVSTVKGYAAHEEKLFTAIADARGRMLSAGSVGQKAAAAGAMNQVLGRLLAVAEAYPQLKANSNFVRLQDELAGTENRIAVARTRYNERVKDWNARIRRFPGVFIAGRIQAEKRDYFEIPEEDRKTMDAPPAVEF